MIKKYFLISLAIFSLSLFAQAGETWAAGDKDFGESCQKTSECIIPLICSGKQCVECAEDSDCEEQGKDAVCVENKCEVPDEDSVVEEDDNPLGDFPGEDFEFGDLIGIITGLACWLGRIATMGAVIAVLVAGVRFASAGTSPENYKNAVANFKMTLWGILVIYGVYVIMATVASAVGITDFSFIPLVC